MFLTHAALFAAGLLALYFGAEWLVRGAARLARAFGVSPLVVGLTVVSFGTSAPELVVSGLAALSGQSDVALGNVVGSNIINIAVILGLTALVAPLRVEMRLLAREVPVMIVAMVLPLLFGLDRAIGRGDGTLLLAGFVLYLWFVLHAARRESAKIQAEYREFEAGAEMEPAGRQRSVDAVLIAAGCILLVIGAHLLVDAALFFARAAGVSELVIGLTVVAFGTSLPELATSVLAGFRREADIAVGNVVGSNIFNTLSILGVAAVVHPVAVDPSVLRVDLPIMIALGVVLLPLGLRRLRVGRLEGALLVGGYILYIATLFARNVGAVG